MPRILPIHALEWGAQFFHGPPWLVTTLPMMDLAAMLRPDLAKFFRPFEYDDLNWIQARKK
jgi:hypothetical protein